MFFRTRVTEFYLVSVWLFFFVGTARCAVGRSFIRVVGGGNDFFSFFLSFFFFYWRSGSASRGGRNGRTDKSRTSPFITRPVSVAAITHTHTHTHPHTHTHTHTHTHRPQSPALIIRRVVWVGGWR